MAKVTKRLFDTEETEEKAVRINKFLSDSGICSRRDADTKIANGEVTIDGEVAVMGSKVLPGQKVMLGKKEVSREEKMVLIAFHKPKGIVCTTEKREPDNIIDYIKYSQRIYPIGRLDKDSEGLILLTNNGDIVNKILRAGNHHEKEYIVTVNKPITAAFLKGMAGGVPILDTVTKPCTLEAIDKVTFKIILTQGLNRQIRRMCEYFDYKVTRLVRLRIMNINLGRLNVGGYRNLTDKELEGLKELIELSTNEALNLEPDDEFPIERVNVGNIAKSHGKKVSTGKRITKDKYFAEKKEDKKRNEATRNKSEVSKYVSKNKSEGNKFGTKNSSNGNKFGAKNSSNGNKFGAKNSSEGNKFGSKNSPDGNKFGAKNSSEGNKFGAKNSSEGNKFGAKNSSDGNKFGTKNSSDGNKFGAKNSSNGNKFGTKNNSEGNKFGSKNRLEGNKFGAKNSSDGNKIGTKNSSEGNKFSVKNRSEDNRFVSKNKSEDNKFASRSKTEQPRSYSKGNTGGNRFAAKKSDYKR
ncbi:MAG TPA: 23S rRNA pseudouridine(2604) synthase RluF [Lachnoclostridium phytofermentans]|uniref:Pseudouridine synthase n=1 Tax=Lachnoclostridium phytofermentans TaxID=66219 RepID=A0A3D2X787_9FIRM|nr:23S rRNA pseudouridine(2604) synthase RluF [Lachnoclostridium sp.]HCL03010.1 23S rRNA pseudouridine(2604) synthase RluF [Lachnoclostridium phytofermentans]